MRLHFLVTFRDGHTEYVSVDSAERRLYRGETAWEIAAAIACVRVDRHHADVQDVKEV